MVAACFLTFNSQNWNKRFTHIWESSKGILSRAKQCCMKKKNLCLIKEAERKIINKTKQKIKKPKSHVELEPTTNTETDSQWAEVSSLPFVSLETSSRDHVETREWSPGPGFLVFNFPFSLCCFLSHLPAWHTAGLISGIFQRCQHAHPTVLPSFLPAKPHL